MHHIQNILIVSDKIPKIINQIPELKEIVFRIQYHTLFNACLCKVPNYQNYKTRYHYIMMLRLRTISPLLSWKPRLHLSAQLLCFFSVETDSDCHRNVNNSCPIIMISFPRVFNRCTALPHHPVTHMLVL